jgi:hypothetical protein
MKEIATKIKELSVSLNKNPWDILCRQERERLINELCELVLDS